MRAASRAGTDMTVRTPAPATSAPTRRRARRRARRPGAARQPALPHAASSAPTAAPSARRASEIIIANAYFVPGRARCSGRWSRRRERGVQGAAAAAGPLRVLHAVLRAPADVRRAAARGHRDHRVRAELPACQGGGVRRPAGRTTVGSSNLDPLSLLLAREANVVVRRRRLRRRAARAACCDAVQHDGSAHGLPALRAAAVGAQRVPGVAWRCALMRAAPWSLHGQEVPGERMATTWSCSGREGLYCPPGDFYIDPWRPVDARRHHPRACRPRAPRPRPLPRRRAGRGRAARAAGRDRPADAALRRGASSTTACACRCIPPATCSARRRCGWSTAARSGWPAATTTSPVRRPREATRPATPFEPVRCDVLHHRIDLRPADLPLARRRPSCSPTINAWWRAQRRGRPRQRADPATASARRSASCAASIRSIGPIVVHGAVEPLNRAYRAAGVALPDDAAGHRGQGQGRLCRRALVVARRRRSGSAPGCAASASTATPSPAAGCSCAARAGARGYDRGFVLQRPRRLARAACAPSPPPARSA